MTQTVSMPDGTVHNFPDEATPAMIAQALNVTMDHEVHPNQVIETPNEIGYGKTAFDQSMQGATFGFSDEMMDRLGIALAVLKSDPGGFIRGEVKDPALAEEIVNARQNTQKTLDEELRQNPKTSIAANIAGGLVTGVAGGSTTAGAAVNNSLRTGNLAARVAKGALAGAASGGLYGAGSAEDDHALEGAGRGALTGGVIGGAVPAVAAGLGKAKGAVLPEIKGRNLSLAQRARDMGIPLRLDQVAPSRVRNTIQKVSQELPFSGADDFEAVQKSAWVKNVAKTIGQDAEDLGPETINNFLSDTGQKFKSAIGNADFKIEKADLDKIAQIENELPRKVTKDIADVVRENTKKFMDDLTEKSATVSKQVGRDDFSGAPITERVRKPIGSIINSEKLSSLRSDLVQSLPNIDSKARTYVSQLVDIIDDVAERNLSGAQAEALKQARREWRNFKTLEPLLEKSTDGTINPTELMGRVKASKYIKASRSPIGNDDLVDLARIGKKFLPQKGGSDTYQKSIFAGGTGAIGVTAMSNPILAATLAAKAGVGLAANRGLQSANSSQRVIDAAIRASSSPGRQIVRPAATRALEGQASGIINAIMRANEERK